jgi:hypothetical protein
MNEDRVEDWHVKHLIWRTQLKLLWMLRNIIRLKSVFLQTDNIYS